MNQAIFFDRDGVLVKSVFHTKINSYGAPWKINELQLYDITNISKLKDYLLFIVSNQPDAKKRNTTYLDLMQIHNKFDNILKSKGIYFTEYYYCFHKKEDKCKCRKPSPYFILEAIKKYDIDIQNSWFVGDRDTDIECGKAAGIKTFKIIENIDKGINNLNEVIEVIRNDENIFR